MLPAIIWSPLEQHGARVSNDCPKCQEDGVCTQLFPVGWMDGSSDDCQPRLLYCVNSNALLLSRIYHCPYQHKVLAHHPEILHRLTRSSVSCLIPFQLWHIAGFPSALVDYVDSALQMGVLMQQIKTMCTSNRICLFHTLKEKFEKLHAST